VKFYSVVFIGLCALPVVPKLSASETGLRTGNYRQSASETEKLDDICGTFGASYNSSGSWTLFIKRAQRFSDVTLELCLDNNCGQAKLSDGYFQREVSATLGETHSLRAKPARRWNAAVLAASTITLSTKSCPMGNPAFAPDSSDGLDVVLSIEKAESTSLPGGFPTMGAVLQSYAAGGTYSYHGAGGPNQFTGTGTFTYKKTGRNTASEDAIQYSDYFIFPYHMDYTFEHPDSGRWIQYFGGGLIVFQGTFATSPTNAAEQWAPESFNHAHVILTTEAADSCSLQMTYLRYTDTSYSLHTLGADSTYGSGTYVLHKMSARSLVEEGTTVDQHQYVRVYTFTSPKSGYWEEASVADNSRTHGWFGYNN
jgi:hypothetical protein